jgi:hypothetical protein
LGRGANKRRQRAEWGCGRSHWELRHR